MGRIVQKAKGRPKCACLDCFACDAGECIALDKAIQQKCPFYKTNSDHRRGVRKSFYRLIAQNRLDLILRYWGEPVDFGPYIKDVQMPERIPFDIVQYREKIRKEAGNDLSDCPACNRAECFAAIDGHCVVLKNAVDNCAFFQNVSDWYFGAEKSFYQITVRERFDLMSMYRAVFHDYGLFSASIEKARTRYAELDQFRQETLAAMRRAVDLEACRKALTPKETGFSTLDKQPDESKGKRKSSPEEVPDEPAVQEVSVSAGAEETDDFDAIIPESDSITTIPDDASQADSQMKEISELVDNSEEDTIAAEETITMVNQSGGSDSDEEQARLHEENRLVRNSAGSVFRIEDFYSPGFLRSQAVKRRSYDDRIIGELASAIVLLTAKDYVMALRRQLLYPEDIDNTIRVLYFENYFGSRDYWLLTNIDPEKLKHRCVEIAMNQEKAAILDDNEKLILQQGQPQKQQDKAE